MENIKIKSSIKQFGIENEDGEVIAVLELDSANTNIVNKFGELYSKLDKISHDLEAELKEAEQYMGDTLTPNDVSELTCIYGKHVNNIIAELEEILGNGFIHDVYARNYELDCNFIPDASLLQELLTSITPILEKVYKKQTPTDKYSTSKKGKKSNADKIAEYKEKMSNAE